MTLSAAAPAETWVEAGERALGDLTLFGQRCKKTIRNDQDVLTSTSFYFLLSVPALLPNLSSFWNSGKEP